MQPPIQQLIPVSTEPPLPNMTLENIEPDEDELKDETIHQS